MLILLLTTALAASPRVDQAAARLPPPGRGAGLTLVVVGPSGAPEVVGPAALTDALPLPASDELWISLTALSLAADGRLPLSTPVATLDPPLAGAPSWLTVGRALDHETGLSDLAGQRLLLQQPPTPAGLSWPAASGTAQHSFANVVLLGRAVERGAGQPLATVVANTMAARFGVAVFAPPTGRGHQLVLGSAWPRAVPQTGVALGASPSLQSLTTLAQRLLSGDGPEAGAILDHDGGAWHLGWEPRDLDGTPALLWSRTGATSQVEILLLPRHDRAFVVVGDTGGVWPTLQPSPAVEAARGWLGLPAVEAPAVAWGSLAVGGGLLALLVACLGSFAHRSRSRTHRPRGIASGLAFAALRSGELGVAWGLWRVTQDNPLGPDGWALLLRQQADLAILVGATGLVLAGSFVGRLVGALVVPRAAPPASCEPEQR